MYNKLKKSIDSLEGLERVLSAFPPKTKEEAEWVLNIVTQIRIDLRDYEDTQIDKTMVIKNDFI